MEDQTTHAMFSFETFSVLIKSQLYGVLFLFELMTIVAWGTEIWKLNTGENTSAIFSYETLSALIKR